MAFNNNGYVTVNWTNTGAQTNRIYIRYASAIRDGTVWTIIKDKIVGANGANSIILMDGIPLGIPVDYYIVSVAANGGESAIAQILGVTISPDYHQDQGGYTAMVHVVNSGLTLAAPLPMIPPIKIIKHRDIISRVMFGNSAPSFRYGTFNYRQIEIEVIPQLVNEYTLKKVLDASMVNQQVLCFRDTMGTVMYCGLSPIETIDEDLYTKHKLVFIEQQFTLVPNAVSS